MNIIGECQGFFHGYKDDYGVWHTYDCYCTCHQCLEFNPEANGRLIEFLGWDSDAKCPFRKFKTSSGKIINA